MLCRPSLQHTWIRGIFKHRVVFVVFFNMHMYCTYCTIFLLPFAYQYGKLKQHLHKMKHWSLFFEHAKKYCWEFATPGWWGIGMIFLFHFIHGWMQCFEFGSELNPDSNVLSEPDPYWESRSGSVSRQAKIVPQKSKKLRNFMFEEFPVDLSQPL